LYAAEDDEHLRETYRASCRLNAIITVPTVIILVYFSKEALLIWTGNPDIAEHAHLILSLLVIGYGLNQLAYLPFALQVAAGLVQLSVYTNTAAVLIIVPALVIASRFYEGVGAASVWIALNCVYVFIFVNVLHGHILKGEARQWYAGTLQPLILAVGVGLIGRHFLPAIGGAWLVAGVGFMWIIVVVTAILASSDLRNKMQVMLVGHR
jgi:O-antigen/teichoic acid export membrane protein